MSFTLDATYGGWHAPTTLKQIISLAWVLLLVAILTASLERPYSWIKTILVFGSLTLLMWFMTANTLALYEPYLAVL